jgi:hypothetical protein
MSIVIPDAEPEWLRFYAWLTREYLVLKSDHYEQASRLETIRRDCNCGAAERAFGTPAKNVSFTIEPHLPPIKRSSDE